MSDLILHNRVEEHVAEAYTRLVEHFPEFCGCPVCRADVLVYALNRLPSRYVASTEGQVVTELQLDKDQSRAAMDVTMMDGFKKVASAPRCGLVEPQQL